MPFESGNNVWISHIHIVCRCKKNNIGTSPSFTLNMDSWHLKRHKSKESEISGPNVTDKYALAVTKNLGLRFSCWPCPAGPLWLQIPIQYYYINFLKMSMKLQKDLSRLCCLSYWKSIKYLLFQVRLFWTFNDMVSPIPNSETFVASTLGILWKLID